MVPVMEPRPKYLLIPELAADLETGCVLRYSRPLYYHLASVRMDCYWAEDSAFSTCQRRFLLFLGLYSTRGVWRAAVVMIATNAVNGFKVAKDRHRGLRMASIGIDDASSRIGSIFNNMLALWYVGAAIEMTHGWVAAAIIFTISAVGGAILSAIFLPEEYITVGASGGIFGFIGTCLADIIMNPKLLCTVALLLQRMERNTATQWY
jgi:hypothetical protein